MQRFLIERDIPEIGAADAVRLRLAARKSNEVLSQLGPEIQWVESYIAGDKLFCVYLAATEKLIRKHSEMSGFPTTKIHKVSLKIDPTLAATSTVGPIPVGHTP
jgi:hypothetical protein